MKKIVVLLTILFASVICTACINNFAVQELNSKAKQFLDAGDTNNAICRLQSSVDLDGSIFESRYNLSIALTKAGKFEKALEQIKQAASLKPDNADVYYTQGVIYEGLSQNMIDGIDENTISDSQITQNKEEEQLEPKKPELTVDDINKIIGYLKEAANSYEVYLEKNPEASDKENVKSQIASVLETVAEYEAMVAQKVATEASKAQ